MAETSEVSAEAETSVDLGRVSLLSRTPYFVRVALRSMLASTRVQATIVGVITVSVTLVLLALTASENVEGMTERWGRGTQIIAYLQPSASEAQIVQLANLVRSRDDVSHVQYVGSALAKQRLAHTLGHRAHLLEEFGAEALPRSLEIRLAKGAPSTGTDVLSGLLSSATIVEEVDHLGRWSETLGSLAVLARYVAFGFAAAIVLVCLYSVSCAMRLAVYSRRQEIQIQRLVGATRAFVHAPFLIEGALQASVGLGLALGLAYAIFHGLASVGQALFPEAIAQLRFLPLRPQVLVGVSTVALGVLAGRLAVGRCEDYDRV